MRNDDSIFKLQGLIKEKRASLVTQNVKSDERYSLELQIPPIPVQVIQESNSIEDMIKVALQLRDDYQELRSWLGRYQQAITQGSLKDIGKYKKMLNSVSKYIDYKFGVFGPNDPTFTTGIGVLKISLKKDPVNSLVNQFGVRSLVNRLILANTGVAEIKKLLGFFGHEKSVIGLKVIDHFIGRKG